MAKNNSSVTNSTIEAMYTVVPRKMSNSQPHCKVFIPNIQPLDDHEVLQKRMQIVYFFKSKNDDDSGWHVGGWIKESLGMALEENPAFAGRLRRSDDDGSLEIVCNDGGVRCIEAQMPLNLVDFLSQSSSEKTKTHARLVHWIDIDEKTPQFSPLFYIQVTNFQCGGYSVGLSYSLLLADPFVMAKFLTRWADIHRSTAYEIDVPKKSFFHTSTMGRNVLSPLVTTPIHHTMISGATPLTMMFNISTTNSNGIISGDEISMYFALLCIKDAENKFNCKMSSYFTLITKEPTGDAKLEVSSKHHKLELTKGLTYELNQLSWKDLRINDISFRKLNAPVDITHWVSSDALEGMVLVVNSTLGNHNDGMKVFVTFPNEEILS